MVEARRAGALRILAPLGAVVIATGLVAGCAPAVDCPAVPGTTAVDPASVLEDFGLDGDLPVGACGYADPEHRFADDTFALVIWPQPPADLLDRLGAIAEGSGFHPEPRTDPEFEGGELLAWADDGYSGAVIRFDELPEGVSVPGYEAWVGAPLGWVGLHAP